MSIVTCELRDHVLWIGLNRPKKLNAFNLELLEELASAYTQLEETPDARVGLPYAEGPHFTAGLDLAEVAPVVRAGGSLFPPDRVDPLDLLGRKRTKPVVCALSGYCFTIGIELALACDIRVASENTRFRQMEVQRGIMAFGGATLRFPQLTGWGNAMRWLLTGDEFDAQEAFRIGLIQQVAPAGEHVRRAAYMAMRVAEQAPLAVRATRRNAALAQQAGPDHAAQQLMEETRSLMGTEDAEEGVRSFIERRDARFVGR